MMPQTQNTDYSNNGNNTMGVAVAPPGQYSSNTSLSGHIPMLNTSVSNQSLMAAALQMNQPNQAYMTAPGLATIGYIYPNGNGYVQSPNLVYNPHNMIHGPVEMLPTVSSSLGHITNSSIQHNHKLSGFDAIQHFGSLSSTQIRKPKNSIMSKTNLYINGLQDSATDESVRALVDGIIEPKSCKAMMSHGKCRGSGFIDCASEIDAEKVIQILRNKQMPDGSRLAVKFAYENEKDDLNVYVRNLPRRGSFTNINLEDLFKEYGQVVSVKLLQSDNQYTGTGFVRYSSAEEAQRAVDHMNGRKLIIGNDDKPVICKLADKGGRRMAHTGNPDVLSAHQSTEVELQHHSNGVLSGHSVSNDVVDKITAAVATGGYGSLQVIQSAPYGTQHGTSWLPAGHASPDLLAQELQSISLATGGYTTIVPGLVQTPMSVPGYPDENTAHQQVLAQLLWNHQQNSRLMAAAAASYPQAASQQQQQHQHQQSQQQPMLHWSHNQAPAAAAAAYYTTGQDPMSPAAYSQLIYPHPHAQHTHQYTNRPPRVVMSGTTGVGPIAAVATGAPTIKAVVAATQSVQQQQQQHQIDQSTVPNGQAPSAIQCVVNGNGSVDKV